MDEGGVARSGSDGVSTETDASGAAAENGCGALNVKEEGVCRRGAVVGAWGSCREMLLETDNCDREVGVGSSDSAGVGARGEQTPDEKDEEEDGVESVDNPDRRGLQEEEGAQSSELNERVSGMERERGAVLRGDSVGDPWTPESDEARGVSEGDGDESTEDGGD
jgi:hypothetical protein